MAKSKEIQLLIAQINKEMGKALGAAVRISREQPNSRFYDAEGCIDALRPYLENLDKALFNIVRLIPEESDDTVN